MLLYRLWNPIAPPLWVLALHDRNRHFEIVEYVEIEYWEIAPQKIPTQSEKFVVAIVRDWEELKEAAPQSCVAVQFENKQAAAENGMAEAYCKAPANAVDEQFWKVHDLSVREAVSVQARAPPFAVDEQLIKLSDSNKMFPSENDCLAVWFWPMFVWRW